MSLSRRFHGYLRPGPTAAGEPHFGSPKEDFSRVKGLGFIGDKMKSIMRTVGLHRKHCGVVRFCWGFSLQGIPQNLGHLPSALVIFLLTSMRGTCSTNQNRSNIYAQLPESLLQLQGSFERNPFVLWKSQHLLSLQHKKSCSCPKLHAVRSESIRGRAHMGGGSTTSGARSYGKNGVKSNNEQRPV